MPDYLIFPSSEDMHVEEARIVKAPIQDEALKLYALRVGVQDCEFRRYVHSLVINAGFSERFWYDRGREVGSDEFKRRVRAFFANQPEYAETYLRYYLGDHGRLDSPDAHDDYVDRVIADRPFPDEMLVYIWLKLQGSWTRPAIIGVAEIPIIEG